MPRTPRPPSAWDIAIDHRPAGSIERHASGWTASLAAGGTRTFASAHEAIAWIAASAIQTTPHAALLWDASPRQQDTRRRPARTFIAGGTSPAPAIR